jgi:hypothetical protein
MHEQLVARKRLRGTTWHLRLLSCAPLARGMRAQQNPRSADDDARAATGACAQRQRARADRMAFLLHNAPELGPHRATLDSCLISVQWQTCSHLSVALYVFVAVWHSCISN